MVEKAVYLVGAVVCLIIAYVSFDVAWRSEGLDIRTFEMSRWLVFVTMPAAFVLLAVEILRYLLGAPSMYHRPAGRNGCRVGHGRVDVTPERQRAPC